MTLNEIIKPVKENLDSFDDFFKAQLKTDVPLLNLIVQYITKKKGKRVRPALVFLSAELCGGVSDRAFTGAAMIELLHTATLIHDDVVDRADERRGMASINAEWNNKVAVLVGDFLLSRGLTTALDAGEYQFLKITTDAVKKMSEGELLQIEISQKMNGAEDSYFKIIKYKTASLMRTCCGVGALSANDDREIFDALTKFGENVGIAFQIRDDVFDLQSKNSIIGKPVGNDLKEKKLTLPLIYSLKRASKEESKAIVQKIKKGKLSGSDIKEISNFAEKTGGVEYASQIALDYSVKAIKQLDAFPDSPAKRSLVNFANFVVDRKM